MEFNPIIDDHFCEVRTLPAPRAVYGVGNWKEGLQGGIIKCSPELRKTGVALRAIRAWYIIDISHFESDVRGGVFGSGVAGGTNSSGSFMLYFIELLYQKSGTILNKRTGFSEPYLLIKLSKSFDFRSFLSGP